MTKEIERKYLIFENGASHASETLERMTSVSMLGARVRDHGVLIDQGYLPLEEMFRYERDLGVAFPFIPIEMRVRDKGGTYKFGIKGDGMQERDEEEYGITQTEFKVYWPQTEDKRVKKLRLTLPWQRFHAEIDFYLDRSLMVAEIEVPDIAALKYLEPLGLDVTEDPKYKNRNLAK